MTTLAAPVAVTQRRATVWALARIEAKRYAKHPLFLVGAVLATMFSAGEFGPEELDYHVIPSFFIGVLGIVVAARLTTSTERSAQLVDAAPVTQTARTAAMCLACAVPAVTGLAIVVMHRLFVIQEPIPALLYGTYGPTDRFVISVIVPVIACAGGPLLGVAVARWLRFPGAALLAVIAVLFWSNITAYGPAQMSSLLPGSMDSASLFAKVLHMFTPYTAFVSGNGDGEHPTTVMTSFTGSPGWFGSPPCGGPDGLLMRRPRSARQRHASARLAERLLARRATAVPRTAARRAIDRRPEGWKRPPHCARHLPPQTEGVLCSVFSAHSSPSCRPSRSL